MAIKKTELYSSLWAGCDELRGGMDTSQYKHYVLTLLFMKYVSDKYKGDPYGMIIVPDGASFDDMMALKGDKEIGDKINKIISALAEENDLKGDAYEYLMRHFATESGKSKGQFYTSAEVSRIQSEIECVTQNRCSWLRNQLKT